MNKLPTNSLPIKFYLSLIKNAYWQAIANNLASKDAKMINRLIFGGDYV
jgi:hypothetical protein